MDSRRDGDARAGGGPPGRGGTPSSVARHLGFTESPLRTATRPTPGALREGLSAVSSLALAPFALLFSRSKPRAPETEAPDPARGAGVARLSAGAPAVRPHARAQVHSAVGGILPSGADPDRRAPSSALAEHRPTMKAFDRGVGDAPPRSQSVPPGTHEEGSAHGVANPQAPDRLQRTPASEDRGVGSASQQAGMSAARATTSPPSVPETNAAPSAPAAQPGPTARPRPPEAKGPAQGRPGASRMDPAASRVVASTLDPSQSHAAAPAPVSRPVAPVAPGRPSHPQVLRRETLMKNEEPPSTLRREEE